MMGTNLTVCAENTAFISSNDNSLAKIQKKVHHGDTAKTKDSGKQIGHLRVIPFVNFTVFVTLDSVPCLSGTSRCVLAILHQTLYIQNKFI